MRERDIVTSIRDAFAKRGAWTMKVHGSPAQAVGIPDLLICYRGLFVAIEVKLPGNSPTKIQQYVMKQIEKAGGIVAVAYSLQDGLDVIDLADRTRGQHLS